MTPEPDWVDLGLPSRILWAKTNLGASSPQADGNFYSWGNTIGHDAIEGYEFSQNTYEETEGSTIESNLSLNQDAAHVAKGGSVRMPTTADFNELIQNCRSEVVTLEGRKGRLFTSLVNGLQVFFPFSGRISGTSHLGVNANSILWSSSIVSSSQANVLYMSTDDGASVSGLERYYGICIRPVKERS